VSDIAVAALLAGTILAASMISIEIGISVALIELFAGIVVGNVFNLAVPSWLNFIGSFAGIVLVFQAGAEVDVPQFRREWRASLSIGLVSFTAPFVVVGLLAYYGLGWNHRQAEIAGLALSTTSLAVVYAVLVETGLNRELVGKRLMSATFVTDIATVGGLTLLFITPTIWIVPFGLVSIALIVGLPKLSPWFFGRYGNRVIEPEIKLVFASLFLLMWLGTRANSQERLRVVAFAFLTPFFFLKGGMNVSTAALWANLGVLVLLFFGKMVPKFGGVYPLARRYTKPHAMFTTLLMSTGLTFGTITSLYGLSAGIIDRTQFSLLIGVVVLSAIVPTAIAQRLFHPQVAPARTPGRALSRDAGLAGHDHAQDLEAIVEHDEVGGRADRQPADR
jgi:Kef-type K+ transport system membrane component KefB